MKPSTSMLVRGLAVGLLAFAVVAVFVSRDARLVLGAAAPLPAITPNYRWKAVDEYRVLVAYLVRTANTGEASFTRSPAALAAEMLGELRAQEGVPALAPRVSWNPPSPHGLHARTIDQTFVAAWSLAQIGMPSVPAMLKNLAEKDDKQVRDRSAWVINKVFMGKKSAARVFLEDAIKEAKDDKARERLIAAREFFE